MANNAFQVKRTTVTGRTPNTTAGSYTANSQWINTGELALNLTDGILYTAGPIGGLITIGSNLTSLNVTGLTTQVGNVSVTGNLLIANALYANGSPGTASYVLTSAGASANAYWAAAAGGSGTPGGGNTQLQYNNSGAFAGNSGLTYNYITNILTSTGNVTANGIQTNNFTVTTLLSINVNNINVGTQSASTNGAYIANNIITVGTTVQNTTITAANVTTGIVYSNVVSTLITLGVMTVNTTAIKFSDSTVQTTAANSFVNLLYALAF